MHWKAPFQRDGQLWAMHFMGILILRPQVFPPYATRTALTPIAMGVLFHNQPLHLNSVQAGHSW
jgi:hypothetical protein